MSLSTQHKSGNSNQTGMPIGPRYFRTASLRISEFPYAVDSDRPVRWLGALMTDESDRRKGYASLLMKRICGEADRTATALVLEPKPFHDGPMDRNALESFYTRMGFERIQDEPVVMSRMPRQ